VSTPAATLDDDLTATFAALADPTRRAILLRLTEGEATVNELAEPFPMTQQAVSRHVKVLERAGLISRARTAQFRPCRLEPARLDTAAEWIARHRRMWDERYDRLDEHLAALRERAADPASEASEAGEAGEVSEAGPALADDPRDPETDSDVTDSEEGT
jgi:DNA-binding transcriptional ArsR family regulator